MEIKEGLLNCVDKKKIMVNAFALLKKQGNNTAEGLLNYLKERKLLDDSTEKIAKQVLAGVSDPKHINYKKFLEVCESVAKEKGFDMQNITKNAAKLLFGAGSIAHSPPQGSSGTLPATDASSSADNDPTEEDDDDDDDDEPDEDNSNSANED